MKETYEFRIFDDNYHLLNTDKGKYNGAVYVLHISKTDPLFQKIGEIDQKLRKWNKDCLLGFWRISRKYTPKELAEAELFRMRIKTAFEPVGEECGTLYDETVACPICGAHRKQVGQLCLKRGTIPRKDMARTIAGEVVVSEKFMNFVKKRDIKGLQFLPTNVKSYYQPVFMAEIELSPQTIVGVNPFDLSTSCEGEIYKCPQGDTIGLNLLSETYVCNNPLIEKNDFFVSKQHIGVNRGVLRPEPLYFCSPKFRQMVLEEKLKGFEFEIAHIV